MKIRALSTGLRQLADFLDQFPNQDVQELGMLIDDPRKRSASLALNVSTLAALSRVNKREWIEFISMHHFPIDIRPRDAARDILGKLLGFLEEEPAAIEYLQERAQREVGTSPEVGRALRALLAYRG